MSYIDGIAESMGVSVLAIKLLATIFISYIPASIDRRFLFGKSQLQHHLFYICFGILMIYWNYGFGIMHSLLCIVAQWLIFKTAGTSVYCIALSFPFQLGYLIFGYVYTSTADYDINWTMPHCILTLRLIGLCFDVYDGHRKEETLSEEQKSLMVTDVPSLLETLGFCYFYGGFIVGPQFSIKRYRSLVKGELTDVPGHPPNSLTPALKRCLGGTCLLLVQVVVDFYWPESLYTGKEFYDSSVFYRFLVVFIRGYTLFYRYIAIWMINEGICILSGLGYHKKNGKVYWDAVRNVRLVTFTIATSFQEIITAFNINTNQWVARYVFKRLRFLGNRTVSHITALYFLAIWHGYHEGYFTCFTYEFLVMTVEKPVREALNKSKFVQRLSSSTKTSWIPNVVGFLHVRFIFGYCVLDFSLRKFPIFYPVYVSVYFYGHFFYIILWILLKVHLSSVKQKDEVKKD